MDRTFSLDEARTMLPEVRQHAEELIVVRADLVELAGAIRTDERSSLGGVPEAKGLEARMHEILEWFATEGIEVKGFAPIIVDFPSELAGDPVLLCWLEGERELDWYHRAEHGFMGRRRLPAG
ncbi:MAG: DUF2203 domain-containing protein [Streptomycetales bacterium]